MQLDKSKLVAAKGYLEGRPEVLDPATLELALSYKRDVASRYIALNPEQLDQRLAGSKFEVTRKYDGELAVLILDGDELVSVNSGGTVRLGLPCLLEAAAALQAAGIKQAVIPAELYWQEDDSRSRVFDVLAALADETKVPGLRLAPFDILSLAGEPFRAASYGEVHAKLVELFGATESCQPVRHQAAGSRNEVKDILTKWVEQEGSEGLVVRSELPIIYKVKPRHSLDLAVIGFSEGAGDMKGQVRSLLVALMPAEGQYQVVGHVGGGMTTEQRRDWYLQLAGAEIPSRYIETDSNHVAFHLVRPEWVIETKINDVIFETPSGPVWNPVLELSEAGWSKTGQVTGIAIVYPVLVRQRDDKAVNASDVRFSQIGDFAAAPQFTDTPLSTDQPVSEVLRRRVFTKQLGGKLMVIKFLVWATHKEEYGYPAYVLSYTNFSSGRADPLQQEVKISSSLDQIMELADAAEAANVKQGWVAAE